ncbi:VanZ family protein [Gracilibacillus kekensis]|uniref:VanZ like family protein n=1 Tax=Gracilibacillus kekensis TaxID=1027249 RepID=A0A1M7N0M9_9BACI|nr:VanZ family protein [Gracilibacillus kekensis]SHM97044.1 VanZ like family protein [Gracilibacillus kekensis]
MKKIGYWLLPILWMAIIYYSSDQPYQEQDIKPFLSDYINLSFLEPYLQSITFTYNQSVVSVDQLGLAGFIEFFIRKGAHVGVFMVLCIWFYLAIRQTSKYSNHRTSSIFAFSATLLYAIFDEWHQGWTPNRTPYIGDVLLDGFGALLAVMLILFIFRKNNKSNKLRK